MSEYIVGIDLGTTNSCIAVMRQGDPTVVPVRGQNTMPSMVAVTESGKRLVGHLAKRQAITNAEHTVYALKRLIGRKWDTAQRRKTEETSSYSLVEGPHGDVQVRLRDQVYAVPDIAAMLLQELKLAADEFLAVPVNKAVIAVPAYFNDSQRQATKDAGTIAGLEVMAIVNEPTAAALAYGFERNVDKTIAVYDLGGGTFDVSIVRVSSNGTFEVLATAGDSYLGGEDFDTRIVEWLIDWVRDEHGIDLHNERMALQRLRDAAETAKRNLSATGRSEISLPFIASKPDGGGVHVERVLTREVFEKLTKDLVDRSMGVCEQALSAAGLSAKKLDEIVLCGGMSRMPLVESAVRGFFGRDPAKNIHPDEAVALGAAIHGTSFLQAPARPAKPARLYDVTPHSLGIMTAGEKFDELVRQNTKIPTATTALFTTGRDNETSLAIKIVQGEYADATRNELLGEFVMTGLRRGPKGKVRLEVTFAISDEGLLKVTAKDLDTHKSQTVEVRGRSGLTEEEVRSKAEDARQVMDARVQAQAVQAEEQEIEKLVAAVERLCAQVSTWPALSGEEQQLVAEGRASLAAARDGGDRRAVYERLEAVKRRLEAL